MEALMSDFKLSNRSLAKLSGVHPDLVAIVKKCIEITDIDFGVICGMRTQEQQKALLEAGKSTTMHSRHLTGHAVDLVVYIGADIVWDMQYYIHLSEQMKKAANELGLPIEWGGDWRTFKDGDHFQLPYKEYP